MRAEFGHRQSKNRGQLIVESMIAITILIIGILGVLSLLSQSLGFYRVAYEEHVAVNLAAEGIEVVKNIIDTNIVNGDRWNKGLAVAKDSFQVQYDSSNLDPVSNKPLNFDPATGIYSYDTLGFATNFKREIIIENKLSDDEIQVNSIVTWKSRGGAGLSINLEDHFYNWR